jgi:hypothetical protein
MITHKDTYRTKLGTGFTFGFEERSGKWVVHILDQPSYDNRDDNPHVIHIIQDGNDRLICWEGPVPTLGDAKIIAALWSDFSERYILTGEHFPKN